ncbi:MAG: hypothetical protein LBL48_05835 [Azoarcus sp.]|nr:hypothetical protein [Azoarcus sp.]
MTGRAARHTNALPASAGDILNLRELEQALVLLCHKHLLQ